ncbi:unnamed protein product [Heligmosomoides polygyrus]|uniref:A-kinase anchor protein 12-like n=1 Tax=Heligmosomoides polygyrus TaxID=6339 RepID=A0A183GW67_HELPZ|nr:unnamed protein product [Heligmosomoides polygyrus]
MILYFKLDGVAKEMTTTAVVETSSNEAKVEEPGQREQEKSMEHESSIGDAVSEENMETSNEEPVRKEPEADATKSTVSLQSHIFIKEETPKRDTFDESIEKTKQGDLKQVQRKSRKQEDARTKQVATYSKDSVKNQEVLTVEPTEEKTEDQKVKEEEAKDKETDLTANVEDSKVLMETTSAVLVTSPSVPIKEAVVS